VKGKERKREGKEWERSGKEGKRKERGGTEEIICPSAFNYGTLARW